MAIPYYNTTPVTDEQSAQPYRYNSHTWETTSSWKTLKQSNTVTTKPNLVAYPLKVQSPYTDKCVSGNSYLSNACAHSHYLLLHNLISRTLVIWLEISWLRALTYHLFLNIF